MFNGISQISKRGFLQKRDNFQRKFLLSPLLLIPLILVIISSFLIKSIQRDFLDSDFLSHLLTGIIGYFLAFVISYIPIERLKKFSIIIYFCSLISLCLV